VDNAWYYTQGVAGSASSVSYPENYSDFDYEAKLWRSGSYRTSSNRIIVRGTPDPIWGSNKWYKGYIFQYNQAGKFSLWKWDSGMITMLWDWSPSDYIAVGGSWNILRAVASGSTIRFYINGIRHLTLTDATLNTGRVGIGMYRNASSTGNGFWVDYVTLSTEVGSDLNVDDEIVSENHQVIYDSDDLPQTLPGEEDEDQTR
jgi:hypothetical protein